MAEQFKPLGHMRLVHWHLRQGTVEGGTLAPLFRHIRTAVSKGVNWIVNLYSSCGNVVWPRELRHLPGKWERSRDTLMCLGLDLNGHSGRPL